MDIDKWIDENEACPADFFCGSVIDVDDLKKLMESYVLVPKVPSDDDLDRVSKVIEEDSSTIAVYNSVTNWWIEE